MLLTPVKLLKTYYQLNLPATNYRLLPVEGVTIYTQVRLH